ncbi:MAG: hypothetical protein VYC42_07875 [Pseudomonadota bacterium]|nr:hypothetical protein [Pseudomonadota bacterium]
MTRSLHERLQQEVDAARRIDIIEQELCPPEPQLLDTCVLQNLDWVDRRIESDGSIIWDDEAVAVLAERYGAELANDLVDLGVLYKEFENRSGYPWLVSQTAQGEVGHVGGLKGARLESALSFFRGHQDDWCDGAYPGLAKGLLFHSRRTRVSPLLLRGLGVTSVDEIYSPIGPPSFLPNGGDRMTAAEALIANVPVVLTTDRATFWKFRAKLEAFGLSVVRPTELLKLYEPYWQALDEEFMRRRDAQR